MTEDKRATTIELTADDDRVLNIIKQAIGADSTIAAIRYAIREVADVLVLDAAKLAHAREVAAGSMSLDDFVKEFGQ